MKICIINNVCVILIILMCNINDSNINDNINNIIINNVILCVCINSNNVYYYYY